MNNEYYNNYHCHTHETNPIMTDSITNTEQYIERAKELGHKNLFTTEHGGTRDIYPVYGLCKKHDLKMIVGAEAYYVDDIYYMRHRDEEFCRSLFNKCFNIWCKKHSINMDFEISKIPLMEDKKKREKAFFNMFKEHKKINEELLNMYYTLLDKIKKLDRKNYHIIIVALNQNGQEELNRILSIANVEGMYNGRPRIDLKLLLSLPKKDVIVTTACVGGRLFADSYMEKFFMPVLNHFGDNFYLETQDHNTPLQIEWNKKIIELNKEYGVKLIHGCDSHYIKPEDAKDRDDFIKGKGIWYDDEESFVMDYPSRVEIVKRYKIQGILSNEKIEESLNNTLIFDDAEDLNLNDDIKMPTIYPELSAEERYEKLFDIVKLKLKEKLNKEVPKSKWKDYIEAVMFEMNIIKETSIDSVRTCDYFLINHEIIKKGTNEYGGVLTRTGRGSAVSFLVNHLLGFTEIDRLDAEVPLYPTRFMSASRILESRSLPDIDYNTADPEPFMKASVGVMPDDGCYQMVAYGTLQSSGAFGVMCRRYGIEKDDYNDFGKMLAEIEKIKDDEERSSRYNEALQDEKFGDILKESEKFIGVIDSISPSPCSSLLWDQPISRKLGLRKIGNEKKGYVICCNIDGYTSDVWKFLKNDLLVVTVWSLIADCYKELGEPIPSIKELRERLDDKVWNLYKDGITKTLNQADSDYATPLVMKYSPKTPAELTAFVAAIRPAFASLLDGFLNRVEYSTGTPELDKLLESSFCYMLYQENIMSYLSWLGIEESGTYDVIKKISKKKFSEEALEELKGMLIKEWISHIGNDNGFESTWQVMHDAAKYAFNSSHALSVAWDSLYGAELKAHHPLVYYSVVFNNEKYKSKVKAIARITPELEYFGIEQKPIKFRYSKANYSRDEKTNSIYKGISSIKFLNEKISEELYTLRNNEYNSFIDLLIDIDDKTSVDSRQRGILIKLDFFDEFGKSKKLLEITELYDKIYHKKQFKKAELEKLNIPYHIMKLMAKKETEKLFKEVNTKKLIYLLTEDIEDKSIGIKERYEIEEEYLGYLEYIFEGADPDLYYVTNFKIYDKNKPKPYLGLYSIKTGETIRAQITKEKVFIKNPFGEKSIIQVNDMIQKPKKKKNSEGKYQIVEGEFKNVIENYDAY